MQGEDIKRAPASLTSDYVDNYFRYLHFTGLFTYRGGGRYITLNNEMLNVIDYLIEKSKRLSNKIRLIPGSGVNNKLFKSLYKKLIRNVTKSFQIILNFDRKRFDKVIFLVNIV